MSNYESSSLSSITIGYFFCLRIIFKNVAKIILKKKIFLKLNKFFMNQILASQKSVKYIIRFVPFEVKSNSMQLQYFSMEYNFVYFENFEILRKIKNYYINNNNNR